MTENRFELAFEDYDTFSISDKDYIQENKHYHTLDEIVELLNQLNNKNNELEDNNKSLQFKIIDILEFITENNGVTRQEMKDWWNSNIMRGCDVKMTEKYEIEEIGNMFRVLKDGEALTTKFENTDRLDVSNLVGELNELDKVNKELKANNDIKFWKLQYMTQQNFTQLILHELRNAIDGGYEVSTEFKQYVDGLKAQIKI